MAANTKSTTGDAPRVARHGYEFGGPLGAFAISFLLPVLLYLFTFACNDVSGCPAPSLLSPSTLDLETLKREVGWPADGVWGLASWRVTGWTLAYYLLSAVLYRVLPGTHTEGVVLDNGGRLPYKFNTVYSTLFTVSLVVAGTIAQGAEFPLWTFMTDNYLQLLTANILIAVALATFVYLRSFSVPTPADRRPGDLRELAAGGQSGNVMYDWFIGRELNPRITLPLLGEFDIKAFMELRPGMLGWMLFNFAHVAKQYRTFGVVTDSILFISIVQSIYIIDSQIMEPAILTTIDITTDGFGMMLSFGDLVWVPFLYSTQTRYLANYPLSLGWLGVVSMGAVLLTGFSIFRLANSQKNTFRTNPDDPRVAHLKYIATKSGSRLIVSGWWGLARHINYFGDWIQSWPYSLPTGLAGYAILAADSAGGLAAAAAAAAGNTEVFVRSDGQLVVPGAARGFGMVFTYFYIVYFAVLLVHRDLRDGEKCARKYGDDWNKYKKIVRWHIVPGLY
ncbi:delta14-sterol reductase [Sporothrix brasiliensis 5110]|uniref:Delta(14)-sterol reductase n=1 Tax=Sporothrix brasiliensis 5110 TaxID=1398154 RepID=A0A0C2ESH4_9PEZI|nr:delta14-sterol reductase [Sporothrix brasiliensis 5110]KIH89314.1 delta14-sterol reductase [Sporothrix brasiliensis 5110]